MCSQSNYDIGNHFWCQQWSHNGTFASVIKNGIILHHRTGGMRMGKNGLPFSSWVAGVPEQTASQPCPRRRLLLDPQQRPGEAMPQPSRPWPKGLSAQQLRPQSCSLRRVETRLRKEGDRSHRLAARGLGWPLFPVGATVWTRLGGAEKRARGEEEIYPRALGGEN